MMRVEFLEQGGEECPLIRISGFDPETCKQLKSLLEQLSSGATGRAEIDGWPGMQSSTDCRLIASTGEYDRGVHRRSDDFFWELTPGSWDNLAGLLEPFCQPGRAGFQWLDRLGDVKVLISQDGYW